MAKKGQTFSEATPSTSSGLSSRMELDSNGAEQSDSVQPRAAAHVGDPFYLTRTPPDSDWGDPDIQWEIDEIVDHYIPQTGPKWYKVAWKDWTRYDGSNTTWTPENELVDEQGNSLDVLKTYNRDRRKIRHTMPPELKGSEDFVEERDINLFRFPEQQFGWLSLRTMESRLPRGQKYDIEGLQEELLELERGASESHELIEQPLGSGIPSELDSQVGRALAGGVDRHVRDDDEISYDSRPAEDYVREEMPIEAVERTPTRSGKHLPSPGPKTNPLHSDKNSDDGSGTGLMPSGDSSSGEIVMLEKALDSGDDPAPQERFNSLSLLDRQNIHNESDAEYDPLGYRIESERTRRAGGQAKYSVQEDWDEATKAAKAQRVEIVNDDSDDDEDCPLLPMGFEYLEGGYKVDKSVRRLTSSLLAGSSHDLGCHCNGVCDVSSSATCACQSYSEFNGYFAYGHGGRFLDNSKDENGADAEVFECTDSCRCDLTCPNRASQKPRDVALEVFKTEKCGWSVRTTADLPKGKVLGTFAGTLITRERAEALEKSRRREWAHRKDPEVAKYNRVLLDRRGYIFDLDSRERGDEDHGLQHRPSSPSRPRTHGQRYSIDAWACGNWTRFINHSCAPNMKVYTAYHQTYDPENPPPGKLVFVTTKKVAADEELTLDYEPGSSGMGRGKQRKTRHKGSLNVFELSQRHFSESQKSSIRGDGHPSERTASPTAEDWSQPDWIQCNCEAPLYICRGRIKI